MDLAVVTAIRHETRAALATLRRVRRLRGASCPSWEGEAGRNRVTVIQGGVGFARAREAAIVIPREASVVISFGFAGGLRAEVSAGAVVLCDAVVWEAHGTSSRYVVPSELIDALAATVLTMDGARATRGTILSSPVVLASRAAKAAAAQRWNAVAVEMEGAALAADAVARGVRLLPVRVVLDPLEVALEPLPAGVESSWTARARLLARPGIWPTLLALRRHLGVAVATLTRTGARLFPAIA
jgi:nucleoside phosphorylase